MKAVRTLALLGLCLLAAGAQAAGTVIKAVQGTVQVQRGDRQLAGRNGMPLKEGDALSSDANAEALVQFPDGARLALRSGSHLQLADLRMEGSFAQRRQTVKLLSGGLRYLSGKATKHQNVRFETPGANVGIRGTDIEIAVTEQPVNGDPAGTYLRVNSGAALLAASNGEQVDVDAGQTAFGGEPELTPRGGSMPRRPAARKLTTLTDNPFAAGQLDRLLR